MNLYCLFKKIIGVPVPTQESLAPIISKGSVLPIQRILDLYKGPDCLPFETKIKLVMMNSRFGNIKKKNVRPNCSLVTVDTPEELVAVGNRLLAYIHRSQKWDVRTDSPIKIIESLRKYGCIPTSDENSRIVLIFPGQVPETCLAFSTVL